MKDGGLARVQPPGTCSRGRAWPRQPAVVTAQVAPHSHDVEAQAGHRAEPGAGIRSFTFTRAAFVRKVGQGGSVNTFGKKASAQWRSEEQQDAATASQR